MNELLFHVPWWPPTILIAAGVFMLYSRRGKGVRRAGAALAGLGVVWVVASYLVDTDVEKVTKRTEQLVAAAGRQEWKTVESLLSPDLKFSYGDRNVRRDDRASLMEFARKEGGRIGLRSAAANGIEPRQSGPTITTSLRVYSVQDIAGDQPFPSDWEFDWVRADGQWVVSEMRLIQAGQLGQARPEDVKPHLPQ